jgi:hypothetical protein
LKSTGTKVYTYHHITAISSPVNRFGPQTDYISSISQNGSGMETVKKDVRGITGTGLYIYLC